MTASDHRPRAALRRRLRPRPLTPRTGTQPRYPKEEVELTLMRLAVTGQILAAAGKYTLPPATEPEQG